MVDQTAQRFIDVILLINYVKVTGPTGAITETWFHQGNDIAVDVNDPNVAVGYMKGKSYRVKISDPGHVYSETTTSYAQDTTAPYFNPPMEVASCTDDSGPCTNGKQTKVRYGDPSTGASYYDSYGNLTREDQYGDTGTSSDDRTIIRSFYPNTTSWIAGLPASEAIYSGIGTGGSRVSESRFYYDNAAAYTTAPTKGNLTKVERWLDRPDSYLATTMNYDDTYGNLLSTTDPLAHTTSICYATNATFPQKVTNASGQQTKTEYYGVNWNTACGTAPAGYGGSGLYGQVKSVTDPNGGQTKTSYDTFGRKSLVTYPDGSWSGISYNNYGAVGAQHIRTDTAAGLTGWTYFDGLGRTIKEKKTGPDSKVIVVETRYNSAGLVYQTFLPYFEGDTAKYSTFSYDQLGRVETTTNPDLTVSTASYSGWSVTGVDANWHQKRETKDAFGHVIKVEEYTGTSPTATLYATTIYEYNVSGNLKSVTDASGNKTTMRYDSLGRKIGMSDPDMGRCGDLTVLSPNSSFPWYSAPCWNYEYDASGNLIRQQDGKGQVIWFQYDALNRLRQKDYGTQKTIGSGDVVYTYDSGTNGIGRLSQVSDLSGSSAYSYDVMGHIIQTDKIVGGTTYITKTQYDSAGRVSAIAYPDNPAVYSVSYEYNGPALKRVYEGAINHVQYSGHNGLGQPGTAVFANGVTTTYTYSNSGNSTCPQDNYRLCTQRTVHGGSPAYQDLRYTYYNVGNVNQIIDNTDANNTQSFVYDELNRLTSAQATVYGTITYTYNEIGNMMTNSQVGSYVYPLSGIRPHAVTTAGSNSYIYDDNGNMTSGAGRAIVYDYDNRPVSITAGGVTTTFLYDGGGARVKKTSNGVSAVYIGKLYENTPDGCIKYIFAGDQRIAMKDAAGSLFYYHTDHLGSSSVVTDAAGNMVERLAYFPYGQTRINTGTKDVHHKFTGQELDAETGLYFYGARYYDPQLGRFISADSIVPNPRDPQDLNRYTYAGNNPLLYTDPTGHFKLKNFLKSVVSGVVGGAVFVLSGGNPVLAGMAAGAAGGAMSGDARNIVLGATAGAVLGGFGAAAYNAFGATGAYGMLAAGGGVAYSQGGWDGLAYFSGGVMGGIGGAVMASNLTSPTMIGGQPIEDDPLHYNGKKLTATDADGNTVGSWDATSGRPGSTPADQYMPDYGPIPKGGYSVNPQQIQRWNDLPWYQKVGAYFGRGQWRGGTVAWGHTRVPIEISQGTYIGPRTGNFFIHGGASPGSAGCIDLGANETGFFGYLSGQNGSVPLTVQYGR